MTGPEGTGTIQPIPSQTEGLAAPGDFNIQRPAFGNRHHGYTDLRLIETYRTPEGYDVSTAPGAQAYLIEVHSYELPVIRNSQDADEALANIERAAIYKDGRHQNVKEHTEHLWQLVEENSPEWTLRDRVIGKRFVRVHDWPEGFGRDTGINDEVGLATKFFREEAGITLLVNALGRDNPEIQAMLQYHGKLPMTPDERRVFNRVHTYDKVEPSVFQIQQEAVLHIAREETLQHIAKQALPKLIHDPATFQKGMLVLAELGEVMRARKASLVDGDPTVIVEGIGIETLLQHIRRPNLWGPPAGSPVLGRLIRPVPDHVA